MSIQSGNTLLNAKQHKGLAATPVRKAKPVEEKQSEMIGLRFTRSELCHIKQKAGLVPIATYLKNDLYTKTDLFAKL